MVHALIVVMLLFGAAGCNKVAELPPQVEETPALPTEPVASATNIATPTATPLPAAAVVNGEIIPLTYFQNEVQRYRASFVEGEALPSDEEITQIVLNKLIEEALLAAAARQAGFSFDQTHVQTLIEGLVAQLGSGSAVTDWMTANFFDDAEFRYALQLSTEAAWQRDQIITAVPDEVEQVHARQIYAQTQAGAERALNSLRAGASFDQLAWEFSPETGGELGWFPRGYLLFPQIEDAAFALAEGEYSEIIPTDIGYHILMVLESAQAHPLSTDARLSLQAAALAAWLENARATGQIEIVHP